MAGTAFLAVLVPIYLHSYGPTNFLWFCDGALIADYNNGNELESPSAYQHVRRGHFYFHNAFGLWTSASTFLGFTFWA